MPGTESTPASAKWEHDGAPPHDKNATHGLETGDEGMVGHHQADHVMLHNAHPHQAHSVGYENSERAQSFESHGLEAFHIKHGRRNKGAEHHPPSGLYEPTALEHTPKTQGVFTNG